MRVYRRWVFVLSVFLFVTVSSAKIDCEFDYFIDNCEFPELFSMLPSSVEEYNALCHKLIYEVITENLRCLNETFQHSPCFEDIEATIHGYMPNITHETEYMLPSEITCLREILSSVCYTNDIQKNCGEMAADMAKEFIRRSYLIEFSCDIIDAQVLLADVDRYKLKSHEQDYLVEIMGDIVTRYGDE
ncbi:hypothetical protein CEXT_648811 [Caerostris extrusa]|uniref:DUF19 domain-containing protein n=1 Tax=Caerostris extrusa TaxID=172846 RepID=A0AAV4PLM1_CAEEX|nr:hypothetical protein CEXT_648811 [Caerostris extrusa]